MTLYIKQGECLTTTDGEKIAKAKRDIYLTDALCTHHFDWFIKTPEPGTSAHTIFVYDPKTRYWHVEGSWRPFDYYSTEPNEA